MAIDAGIVVGWDDDTAIPAGWARLTDFDGRFPLGADASGIPGLLGGSVAHSHSANHTHAIASHTHSGSWGTSAPSDTVLAYALGGSVMATSIHTHTMTVAAATGVTGDGGELGSGALSPPYRSVILIESDGTSEIEVGCRVWLWGTAIPAGWEIDDEMEGRIWKGAEVGTNGGGTGGAFAAHGHPNHTHPMGIHTHPVNASSSSSGALGLSGNEGTATARPHAHSSPPTEPTTTANTGSAGEETADGTPPLLALIPLVSTVTISRIAANIIVGWYGLPEDIPAGWEPCDGLDGRPDLTTRFPYGDITGSNLYSGSPNHTHAFSAHTHTATHAHPTDPTGVTYQNVEDIFEFFHDNPDQAVADDIHAHSFTPSANTGSTAATASSTTGTSGVGSNLPPYCTLVYLIKQRDFFGRMPRRRYNAHRILPYRERVR